MEAGGPGVKRWWRRGDGAVVSRTLHAVAGMDGRRARAGGPARAVEIDAHEAARLLERITAENAAADAADAGAARRRAEQEYAAMVEAGLPATVAARLSGHQPAEAADEQTGQGGAGGAW